jgi:hypothetical protein
MPEDRDLYRFIIKAYSPDRIPMSRLAEYMTDLADLLGEKAAVHFSRLEPSSTALAYWIEPEATPKVRDRVHRVTYGEGSFEATRAAHRLNRRLRADNGFGYIEEPSGGKIIDFPGVKELTHKAYAPFWQTGHLSGVVVLVGNSRGKVPVIDRSRSWVAVHLEAGERTFNCVAKRGVARKLGGHLLADPVRCEGRGRWERGADGLWTLLEFQISSFMPLDNASLGSVVEQLRAVPGRWKEPGANPFAILETLKGDDGEIQ